MADLVVRSKRDIIDFVNTHPAGTRRTKILALIALGSIFADAYDFTSLGIGIDSLQSQFGLTTFQVSAVTTIMAIGALIGAFAGGYIADRTGRFKLFIIDGVLLVVAAIGAALAPNLGTLLVFRFLLGIGVGLDMPVAFSFIAELSNTRSKGKWVNFWQSVWYIAVISAALIALPIHLAGVSDDLWRWAVGFGAVPALAVLLLRVVFTEESPMWAAHHRGLEEAAKILEKSYGIRTRVEPTAESEPRTDSSAPKQALSAIFTKEFRARTILASVISGTQAIQYYAVGFYIPVIAGLMFGADVLAIILATILINLFGLVGGSIQPFVTHRMGLWKLATIGYTLVAASLLVLGLLGDSGWAVLPVLSIMLVGVLLFGHTFGPGAQGKTMAALSYPTEYRGVGTGWAETVSRAGTIIGLFIFPLLLTVFGQSLAMLLLASVPLAGLITLLFIRWEPIGQDVETTEIAPADSALYDK